MAWAVVFRVRLATYPETGGEYVRVEYECSCGRSGTLLGGNSLSCPNPDCESGWAVGVRRGTHLRPTYHAWRGLVDFHRFSAETDSRWTGGDGFDHFLADLGLRPEGTVLDRRDRDGPFDKANCYWRPKTERRPRPTRVTVDYSGDTPLPIDRLATKVIHRGAGRTVLEWAEKYGVDPEGLYEGLMREGLSFEKAVSEAGRTEG